MRHTFWGLGEVFRTGTTLRDHRARTWATPDAAGRSLRFRSASRRGLMGWPERTGLARVFNTQTPSGGCNPTSIRGSIVANNFQQARRNKLNMTVRLDNVPVHDRNIQRALPSLDATQPIPPQAQESSTLRLSKQDPGRCPHTKPNKLGKCPTDQKKCAGCLRTWVWSWTSCLPRNNWVPLLTLKETPSKHQPLKGGSVPCPLIVATSRAKSLEWCCGAR